MRGGRVARDLRECDYRVVAVDRSRHLLYYAKDAEPTGIYLLANAARLPIAAVSCDLVVVYNSLMDVADMPATVSEAARVLESGGHLRLSLASFGQRPWLPQFRNGVGVRDHRVLLRASEVRGNLRARRAQHDLSRLEHGAGGLHACFRARSTAS